MNQRDIWLVPFPFSDQTGKKVRPILLLSKDQFNNSSEDVIVCAITSNISEKHSISLKNEQLEEGELLNQCAIKPENVLKINKKLFLKRIGRINHSTFTQTLEKFYNLFE
ncbi:MAG TPA: type II toxin-antitoxin system PemK/MazF family toxin [Candidatus Nanoarchaeia archaeon]|nr:type II toxin-antitoxin system PemK/MazF family toxin [Candidatus Nanoarchaeia archaeon]